MIPRSFPVETSIHRFVCFWRNATDRPPGLDFSLTPHYPRNYPETGLAQPTAPAAARSSVRNGGRFEIAPLMLTSLLSGAQSYIAAF